MKKSLAIATEVTLLSAVLTQQAFAQSPIIINRPGYILPGNGVTVSQIISFVLTLLVIVGVIAAIIFLIYGGIKWITSGGDKAAVESARNHIVAAIIGLVVIILAFVIINVVLSLLGVNSANVFNIALPNITGS